MVLKILSNLRNLPLGEQKKALENADITVEKTNGFFHSYVSISRERDNHSPCGGHTCGIGCQHRCGAPCSRPDDQRGRRAPRVQSNSATSSETDKNDQPLKAPIPKRHDTIRF